MSDFNAIRAVTDTLELIIDQTMGIAVEKNLSPAGISLTTPLVSIFLYRVEPNPFIANLEWQVSSATQLVAPPFALNLHYLITPYGADQSEIQQILGEVMRVFHENAVIRTGHPALSVDLNTMTEELRIVPRPLSLADDLELWKSFGTNVTYRLAITYEVSAIIIDSTVTRNISRVYERQIELGTMR